MAAQVHTHTKKKPSSALRTLRTVRKVRIAELGFGIFLALKTHHALWWLHSEQHDDPSAPSTLKPYTIVCVCAIWRFHGLRIHHHGCAHGNACIKRAACDWLCTIGLRQKLTSPLCIVKVKTTRGQNDMNKSIIAPPAPRCASWRGENCISIFEDRRQALIFTLRPGLCLTLKDIRSAISSVS